MSPHHSDQMSQRSQVSKYVFAIVFLSQVISSHHSDQMSQRAQVSRIAPLGWVGM